jgi:hypothetical protein
MADQSQEAPVLGANGPQGSSKRSSPLKVYVLIIEHRHGRNVSVHYSDEEASIEVAAYCRDWWDREVSVRKHGFTSEDTPTEPMPDDPGQLIAQYFEAADDESWSVEECDFPS